MFKLLLKMLLLSPDLLQSHAQGYADLASEVGARYLCRLKNRWVMYGLAALALWLAFVFGGVALLLWSAFPLHDAPHAWVLWALPASFMLISTLLWWSARRVCLPPVIGALQTQIQLDILAIHQAHPA